jgi:hypothetical protein
MVIVNVSVLVAPNTFVYVAVKVFVGEFNGILLICREVDVNPLGPVHLQEPPVVGCGARSTVAPTLTVTLLVSSQAPPFTWR